MLAHRSVRFSCRFTLTIVSFLFGELLRHIGHPLILIFAYGFPLWLIFLSRLEYRSFFGRTLSVCVWL